MPARHQSQRHRVLSNAGPIGLEGAFASAKSACGGGESPSVNNTRSRSRCIVHALLYIQMKFALHFWRAELIELSAGVAGSRQQFAPAAAALLAVCARCRPICGTELSNSRRSMLSRGSGEFAPDESGLWGGSSPLCLCEPLHRAPCWT